MAFQGMTSELQSPAALGTQLMVDGYFDGYSALINAGPVKLLGGVTATRTGVGAFSLSLGFAFKQINTQMASLQEQSSSKKVVKFVQGIPSQGVIKLEVVDASSGSNVDVSAGDFISFLIVLQQSAIVPLASSEVL